MFFIFIFYVFLDNVLYCVYVVVFLYFIIPLLSIHDLLKF